MLLLRSFRAIVWLRWRLLLNNLRGPRRGDTIEQVSRMLAALVPVAFLALSLGTIVAVCVLGFLAGRAISTGLFESAVIVLIVRITLIVVFALLVTITIAAPVQTTLTRYSRLLIMPIPRQALHAIEVLANLVDPWIAFIVPALALFAVGLAMGGQRTAGLVALVAGAALLLVLATTGALISSLVGWLLRSRRRGETFTIVIVLGLTVLSFVPAAISSSLSAQPGHRVRPPAQTVEEFDRSLPRWSVALPSELYGRAVLAAIERRRRDAAWSIGAMGLEGVALFLLSSAAHKRLINSVESSSRRRRTGTSQVLSWRLPLAGAAVSGVAITEFRTALRSVRGRLAVLLPGPMVAVFAMIMRGVPEERPFVTAMVAEGYPVLAVGLVIALYAMQPFTMNLFGTDRAGLTRLFLVPVTDVELARGKIAGCALVLAAAGLLCTVTVGIVAPSGSLAYWIATMLGGMATFALLSPIAVWLSAVFPVQADLSKTGNGGNPHPLPMFAGTVVVLALAAPAVGIFLANWVWFRHPGFVLATMIVWLAVTIVIAVPLVGVASRAIGARRENLCQVTQGR